MALEKPFIHSLTAEGDPSPVNFNDVFTFEKAENNVSTINSNPRFSIIFHRDENSVGPKSIEWKYKNECDRNAEHDLVLAKLSNPIQ